MLDDHRGSTPVKPGDPITRVLHLIGTSEMGGTEQFLIRLLQHIDAGAFQSRIVVLDQPGRLATRYSTVAEHVEHLNFSVARLLPAVRRWRQQIAVWKPDVLVLYGFRANMLGRLWRAGTPAVMALRSVFVDDQRRWSAAWLDRLTFGRVSVCVSNSRAGLDGLRRRGYPAERLVYIPNAIETNQLRQIDRETARSRFGVAGEPVLVNVANLKPAKGHDTLLAASAQLKAAGIRHVLWLVGDGPERQRLEQLCLTLALTDTVRFVGVEDDVPARLAAADIAVFASRWEGMPTALLEAMVARLPVVASRVGEIPDIVEDGVFGRLVPPGNPTMLAAAIADLLGDRARRQGWGERASEAARRFSLTRAVRQYEAIFRWAARHGSVLELPAITASVHEQKAS
jgi:glycosyltransferase involved in cell wall biosynthesis